MQLKPSGLRILALYPCSFLARTIQGLLNLEQSAPATKPMIPS